MIINSYAANSYIQQSKCGSSTTEPTSKTADSAQGSDSVEISQEAKDAAKQAQIDTFLDGPEQSIEEINKNLEEHKKELNEMLDTPNPDGSLPDRVMIGYGVDQDGNLVKIKVRATNGIMMDEFTRRYNSAFPPGTTPPENYSPHNKAESKSPSSIDKSETGTTDYDNTTSQTSPEADAANIESLFNKVARNYSISKLATENSDFASAFDTNPGRALKDYQSDLLSTLSLFNYRGIMLDESSPLYQAPTAK